MVCLSSHQSVHCLYHHLYIIDSFCPSLYDSSVVAPVCASSIQHVCTSCIMSVSALICALPMLSVHLTDNEHQEFPDKFPSTNYGDKNLSEIMAKIPNNVTLTLHHAKFLEETPGTTNGVKYPANFLVT